MPLVVKGYKELVSGLKNAPKDVQREVREAFRAVGNEIRDDAEETFGSYASSRTGNAASARASHAASAEGFKTKVRVRGIDVEQTRRKTTGLHPKYGGAQMRHGLLPAVEQNKSNLYVHMKVATEQVVAAFERRAL